jgi:ribosomal protein S12 methylthiotransferase
MATKRPSPRPRVALLSLGCAKNLVDSERIAAVLEGAGARVVHDAAGADAAIVNTCGFIESAKEESIAAVLEAASCKGRGGPRSRRRLRALIVTGCLSARYGEELRRLLPEVDTLLGIDPEQAARAALDAVGLADRCPAAVRGLRRRRLTPAAWSYLVVSEGCDNRCAYCAIPLIRGPLRSRPAEELLAEARALVETGARELNVIAQDTAAYGVDLDGKPAVHTLLRELCRIDGLRWVRLLYAHPAHFYDELIEVVASEEKVCPYLDVPLQHVNDGVLARMGRRITRRQTEDLIARLRREVPGLTLRTTFLVGFPGEDDAAFDELLAFVEQTRFERLGCFAYSREEGTAAAKMPDQVAPEAAQERLDRLMSAQQEIAFELSAARVGERTTVLLEQGAEGDLTPARSPHEAPDVDPLVYVIGVGDREPGAFVDVDIVDSAGYDSIARAAPEESDGA